MAAGPGLFSLYVQPGAFLSLLCRFPVSRARCPLACREVVTWGTILMNEVQNTMETNGMMDQAARAVGIAGARALIVDSPASYSVTGELMPRQQTASDKIANIGAEIGWHIGDVADNYPEDLATRWRLDNLATTGASKPLDEVVGQEIEVQYWRVSAVDIADPKNGEVNRVPRTVLVTRDGQLLHASSIGVFQVVASLARTFGREELPKGFRLRVAELKTRMGWRMLTLQAV